MLRLKSTVKVSIEAKPGIGKYFIETGFRVFDAKSLRLALYSSVNGCFGSYSRQKFRLVGSYFDGTEWIGFDVPLLTKGSASHTFHKAPRSWHLSDSVLNIVTVYGSYSVVVGLLSDILDSQ